MSGHIPIGLEIGKPATSSGSGTKGKQPMRPGGQLSGPSNPPQVPLPALPTQKEKDKIRKVLDTGFLLRRRSRTLRETIGQEHFDRGTGKPDPAILEALEEAFANHRLSPAEQGEVFDELEWNFECLDCHVYSLACQFDKKVFHLWDNEDLSKPKLRGGPCNTCHERGRMSGSGGIGYKVTRA
ncbi:hypothetical protein QQS21_008848 [Conoideocrella luteorostrata]|uniref:Uncharacterized protein n=1 Tax=Conoideocrella luteorostrata TaxID=1105319 RepID=A0AAJ0FYC7_9HYPO|nr:hypothetical protein QQS21_008848 [Conoideocrella luteorostrata]